MSPRFASLACACALAATAAAQAAEDIDRGMLDERRLRSLETATGFIIDRTVTNFGAEFVRYFSQAWREQDGTESLDVTIFERPSARYGSMVWVEHNNRPVARVFLYAGRSGTIQPSAVAAAQYVARKVGDESLAQLLLHDPDLARDGF